MVEAAKPTAGKTPLPPADWPPDRLYYIDTGLAEGWYSYKVSGVDIFGRHSKNSASGPWLQWTPPPPNPRPWYYKEPPPADSVVHPFAVRLIDTMPPPPPTGIEAYALDPADPTILKDAAYNTWYNSLTTSTWYQSLTETEKKNLIGLRVRWLWTHTQMRQAPDTKEFRIYYHPDYMNAMLGTIQSITPVISSPAESDVVTDIAVNSPLVDAYKGAWLQVSSTSFEVLSSQGGSPLRLRVGNSGPNKDNRPPSNVPCTLVIPEGHSKYTNYDAAANWQERYHVVDYNSNVTQSLVSVRDASNNELTGSAAAIVAVAATDSKISLDGSPDLSRIRQLVVGEHIFLAADTNRQDKTYQIISVDNTAKTVTVAGTPNVAAGTTSTWKIGFPLRTYEIFLPEAGTAPGAGLPLVTSLTEPIKYASISVSAADDKAYALDKRTDTTGPWKDRSGNEGAVGAPAKIFRVRREPPPTPTLPPADSDKVYATAADYNGHSVYTFRWVRLPNLRTHIFRALDESIFDIDWSRPTSARITLNPNNNPEHRKLFPLESSEPRWTPLKCGQVAAELNALNDLKANGASIKLALQSYHNLSNDALRVLAGLPTSESAFRQLTIQPLDMADQENADHRGPDDTDNYTARMDLCAFQDMLDGRSTNRYFYRTAHIDGVHNRSKDLSMSSPPVYCQDVMPPSRAILLQASGGDKVIRLRWLENAEEDLDRYVLYRADSFEKARDVRLMTQHEQIAITPTTTLRQGEVAPSFVTDEGGNRIARRLQYDDRGVSANLIFYYRLAAVDKAGNSSEPSDIVAGRAYQLLPDPPTLNFPVWDAEHKKITLTWTSADPDLESMVERRVEDSSLWISTPLWLPRGLYTYQDEPPDSTRRYEYRIKVRDTLGQINSTYQSQLTS